MKNGSSRWNSLNRLNGSFRDVVYPESVGTQPALSATAGTELSMNMKDRLLVSIAPVIICALAVLIAFNACTPGDRPADNGQHKIKVITTLFPLYDMARGIGADKAEVSLLLPPGVEAHSFEPRPSDVVRINRADIFIFTGKFMEPWAEGIIRGVENRDLIVVDASKGTKMISGVSRNKDEQSGLPDPHIWLDFDNAEIMVRNITRAFQEKDPDNKTFYEDKAGDFVNKLIELDSAYKTSLSGCRNKEIVYAGHYAFGYLAHRYGLKYLAAQGVSPDAEPTARDLARLVEQIKKGGIKYIFYEELTSPRIAETIAGETGTRMLSLNAAHNVSKNQLEEGVSFFDILKKDLDNLKVGLECE
jgi:zinc transport system substrate-binding protein